MGVDMRGHGIIKGLFLISYIIKLPKTKNQIKGLYYKKYNIKLKK